MISAGTKGGRIVFVGSFLALTTFVGYAGYAPGKYALKGKSFRNTSPDYRRGLIVVSAFLPGLADTLRSEFQLYDINVHLYLPAGILSPNYEVENRTKPDITKKIEEGDAPMTPDECVKCLMTGMPSSIHHSVLTLADPLHLFWVYRSATRILSNYKRLDYGYLASRLERQRTMEQRVLGFLFDCHCRCMSSCSSIQTP